MNGLRDIDFLIIGATKSATTWLQQALQADPGVRAPGPELHYFSRFYDRGDAWYLAQFPDTHGATAIGEKSNSYLEAPEAAGRIAEKLPNVRLIAQLRDPVERAYSDYCMLYRRGEVGRDVERWLDPRVSAEARFIAAGLYHRQLERFLDRFPRDRVHVTLYEEAVREPGRVLDELRSFLGLGPAADAPALRQRVKDRTAPVTPPGVKRAVARVLPLVDPYRHTRFFQSMRAMVAREVHYPPLPTTLRDRLHDHYAGHNARLEALTGLDLSAWRAGATAERLRRGAVAEG